MEPDKTKYRIACLARQAKKDLPEKSGFAFTGSTVVTEELGDGAGQ
ncbi:hypothetical protein [Bacillus sp. UMB0893]|nr:hypothetical protein [Bacillus sp. UMB0893]QNG59617.1 hypothetical protein H4O14_17820 [Bacillus sp. PAMC26568]